MMILRDETPSISIFCNVSHCVGFFIGMVLTHVAQVLQYKETNLREFKSWPFIQVNPPFVTPTHITVATPSISWSSS